MGDGKMQMKSASFVEQSKTTGTKRTVSAMGQAYKQGGRLQKLAKVGGGGLQCVVKSYNAQKGWGFLQSPQIPGDVYFKRSLLALEQQSLELVGVEGTLQVQYTPDGKPQATVLKLYA